MKFTTELFLELRELGYNDLIIADRFGLKPESLLRHLWRHGIEPSALLTNESNRRKYSRSAS